MFKKILCMAMAFAVSASVWSEDLKTVMSYYKPEMAKGFIFISKVDMTLTLVNSQGQIVVTYPIACGQNLGQKTTKGDHKTPEGHFLLQNIHEASTWGHDFHDGKGFIPHAYGPYFLRLQTGFQGIGIHGTHAPESIGTRATEGCIRLDNDNVAALERQVRLGMPVIIGPESGVESLIARHVPSPSRPVWGRPAAPKSEETRFDPIVVDHKLDIVNGQLSIDPEKDLVDPVVVAVPDVLAPVLTTPAETQPEELLAVTETQPVLEQPAVNENVAESPEVGTEPRESAPKNKHRRRQGPTYIKPDTTAVATPQVPVTQPQYEVVVVEITQPDGSVKYEVQYKPI